VVQPGGARQRERERERVKSGFSLQVDSVQDTISFA
jgi:hypothetical protein